MRQLFSESTGKISFENVTKDVTYKAESDEQTGFEEKVIIESKDRTKSPIIKIIDKSGETLHTYNLPVGAHITVNEGDKVKLVKFL